MSQQEWCCTGHRVAAAVEHHPWAVGSIFLTVDAGWRAAGLSRWFLLIIAPLFLLGFFAWLILTYMHRRKPCEVCWEREHRKAAGGTVRMQWYHYIDDHRGRIFMVWLFIGASLGATLHYVLGVPEFIAGTVAAVYFLTIIVLDHELDSHHAWLRPWCPWCKDDPEDDHEHQPEPDPTRQEQRT